MGKIVIDDVLLREPRLLTPMMQPIGPVDVVRQKGSFAEKLTYMWLFNRYYTANDPYDGITNIVTKIRIPPSASYPRRCVLRTDIGGVGLHHSSSLIGTFKCIYCGLNSLDDEPHSAFVVLSLKDWPSSSINIRSQTSSSNVCGLLLSSGTANAAFLRSGTTNTQLSTTVETGALHCFAWSAKDGNFRMAHKGIIAATSTEVNSWVLSSGMYIEWANTVLRPSTIYAYGAFKDTFLSDAELCSLSLDPYQLVEPA